MPSPDGALVALTTTDVLHYPAATHLAVLDPATGSLTDLTAELDRDCDGGSIVWLDAATVAVVVHDAGAIGVRVFDVARPGPSRVLVGGPRRVTAFDARAGRTAVVTSGPVDPPAVAVLDRRRRRAGAARAQRGGHGASGGWWRPRTPPSRWRPGSRVDSWLVPAGGGDGPFPLVVWLQGGGTQYGWQFSHELQLLVAAGHAVVYLNPRGSAGYGTAWMRTVAGPRAAVPGSGWGLTDVADVVAVLRATLAAHPKLDAGRVGVMGGSYGGLLTTHLLAQTDLFRAGWAERGPYDLYSDAGTKDEAPWFFEAYLGGSHLEDAGPYWQASPIRLVHGITAPLAIVHSEEDRRCSIGQAEELFMALKLLDREVELIRFPGECHAYPQRQPGAPAAAAGDPARVVRPPAQPLTVASASMRSSSEWSSSSSHRCRASGTLPSSQSRSWKPRASAAPVPAGGIGEQAEDLGLADLVGHRLPRCRGEEGRLLQRGRRVQRHRRPEQPRRGRDVDLAEGQLHVDHDAQRAQGRMKLWMTTRVVGASSKSPETSTSSSL